MTLLCAKQCAASWATSKGSVHTWTVPGYRPRGLQVGLLGPWGHPIIMTRVGQVFMVPVKLNRSVLALIEMGCRRTLVRKAQGAEMAEILQMKCVQGDAKNIIPKWCL